MRVPENLLGVLELGVAMLAGQADDHELNKLGQQFGHQVEDDDPLIGIPLQLGQMVQ